MTGAGDGDGRRIAPRVRAPGLGTKKRPLFGWGRFFEFCLPSITTRISQVPD